MSHVNNFILVGPPTAGMQALVDDLNQLLSDETGFSGLSFVAAHNDAGGPKAMEMSVYLGALNYVDPSQVENALVQALTPEVCRRLYPWDPSSIQLFVRTQHSDRTVEVPLNLSTEGT
jgi:hypothetical protein